ncbi:hypothetical protein [Microcoleus sp. N9_A1]|uniref:hypothetical protein n=1 Tax=Microcoleus sp. N9_A1 TaxID=3055380 RepID=UPI002FD6B2FD
MTQTGERPSGPDTAALSTETPQAQVAAKTASGYSIKASTTDRGFAVQYTTPSGRDPNKEWDWIGVYERSDVPPWAELGNYKTWNWVCPNQSCGSQGTTLYHFFKVMTDFRKQGKWINYNVLSSSISIGSLEKWY